MATPEAYGPRFRHGGFVGFKEQPLHYVWRSMMSRCYRPTDKAYPRYGGLGVSVAPPWRSYAAFAADMGPHPGNKLTLDRIDPRGNYEPGNVRWADVATQANNKRGTRLWVKDGVAEPMAAWAKRLGISKELAHWRMKQWGTFQKGESWQELQKWL
jgi:hypothetical protein